MDLNKNYKLNKQQSRALALMCQDKNIFITAPAGAVNIINQSLL